MDSRTVRQQDSGTAGQWDSRTVRQQDIGQVAVRNEMAVGQVTMTE